MDRATYELPEVSSLTFPCNKSAHGYVHEH